MEAILAKLSDFLNSPEVYDVLSKFSWVDGVAFFFFFVGMAQGAKRGFLIKLLQLVELTAIIYLVFRLHQPLDGIIRAQLRFIPAETGGIFAYIALALALWMVFALIDSLLSKIFTVDLTGPLRNVGGALFGVAHGVLIWSFIAHALMQFPIKQLKQPFQPGYSYTGFYVRQAAPAVYFQVTKMLGGNIEDAELWMTP